MTIISVIQYPNEYQVTYSTGTVSFVPFDSHNSDYMRIQQWIAAGGVPVVESMS